MKKIVLLFFFIFCFILSFDLFAKKIGKIININTEWGYLEISTNFTLKKNQKVFIKDINGNFRQLSAARVKTNKASLTDQKLKNNNLKYNTYYNIGMEVFDEIPTAILKITKYCKRYDGKVFKKENDCGFMKEISLIEFNARKVTSEQKAAKEKAAKEKSDTLTPQYEVVDVLKERLKDLKELFEEGLINEQKYNQKKQEILDLL